MDDQVKGDAEGCDQQYQQGNENGIVVHPQVVRKKNRREENIQYRNIKYAQESCRIPVIRIPKMGVHQVAWK